MDKLTRDFYDRDTIVVARELLGKHLVRVVDGVPTALRITETEAYIGRMDKACHAYGYKRTKRTETLFAPPGTAYIYLIYGMYHCLNFVTEGENEPAAVLLRAGVPVTGADALSMSVRRFTVHLVKCPHIKEKISLTVPESSVKPYPLLKNRTVSPCLETNSM